MNKLFVSVLILMALFSCKDKVQEIKNSHEADHENTHWGYTGETSPEHWAELEENAACSGKYQSPINIVEFNTVINTVDTKKIKILYSPETELSEVINNGHSIEFDFKAGDSLSYLNGTYHLKQIHFHEPSEHTINGIRYPIEIHLVHMNTAKEYTVISILGKEGNESDYSDFFNLFLPLKQGERKEVHESLDLRDLFPQVLNYYSYKGSLTTPPCTETVNWVIFKEAITISEEAATFLKENMPLDNYRNNQALNGRIVYHNTN